MQPSSLLLRQYFVTTLNMTAQQGHDPDKPVQLKMDDLQVSPAHKALGDASVQWQVDLSIKQDARPESNAPYAFDLHMVGIVDVAEAVPEEEREQFAAVNGCTVLFGAAREILRTAMGHGPYRPMLLPSVNFAADFSPNASGRNNDQGGE